MGNTMNISAADITSIAKRIVTNGKGWYGGTKVLLVDVVAYLGCSVADVRDQLVTLNASGSIVLARIDYGMTNANVASVQDSAILDMGNLFHAIETQ